MAKTKVPGGHMVGIIPVKNPDQEKAKQDKPKLEKSK